MAEETLTEKEQLKRAKKEAKARQDKADKENEIKYGLRFKLITIISALIVLVVIIITNIATRNQTESLMEEKKKQGEIITRGLAGAIKTRLLDIYASNSTKISRLKSERELVRFYQTNFINELIFEDIDQVLAQPDILYAFILGREEVVLGHSNPEIEPYTRYKNYIGNVKSYFNLFDDRRLEKIEPILTLVTLPIEKINNKSEQTYYKEKGLKKVEAIDFAVLLSFKKDTTLEEAIGEIHICMSLESVNEQIFQNKVEMQLIGLIAVLVSVITAFLVAHFLARPIRTMINGMRKVSQGDFTAVVSAKSKDEVGLLSKTFNVMLKGMSVLVSPEVAQVVLSGGDLLKSGQKRNVTVLFSDIRSFTTISESLTPAEVVEMLNDYMEIMTDIIIKYGGVVDKFVGDEIFAVYGAPFDHPIHPLAATATALEMVTELNNHNDERMADGRLPIQIGIGVNTGDVISGAMGSTKRIDFTSIGDAVNLGARLEGTNKVYGTVSIISEYTFHEVKGDVITRELDLIKVKGKNEPVKIFEVVALTPQGEAKVANYIATLNKTTG